MRDIQHHLERLRALERKRYHPLIHKIHKKHNISKKTLFYVKEYGPHSNVPRTIIKESLAILLLASVISSFGGLALENIKVLFIAVMPLIILLPALNDMVGDYGTIIASRFSTMLHEGRVRRNWFADCELRKLFSQVLVISVLTAVFCAAVALILSGMSDYAVNLAIAARVFFITIVDVILLVSLLFITAVLAGLYFFRKGEDPNNFLIPITTSVADFGNMALLSILVVLFF